METLERYIKKFPALKNLTYQEIVKLFITGVRTNARDMDFIHATRMITSLGEDKWEKYSN